jgi:hypothetical protein
MVGLEDTVDDGPCGLNCVFTGKERAVADHGITQKALIGRFVSGLFI